MMNLSKKTLSKSSNKSIGLIGFTSHDVVKIKEKVLRERIGGKTYYTGIALSNLGSKVIILNKGGKTFKDYLNIYDEPNIHLIQADSDNTPKFENKFLDKSMNDRILT